jgi:hypothetical protein
MKLTCIVFETLYCKLKDLALKVDQTHYTIDIGLFLYFFWEEDNRKTYPGCFEKTEKKLFVKGL